MEVLTPFCLLILPTIAGWYLLTVNKTLRNNLPFTVRLGCGTILGWLLVTFSMTVVQATTGSYHRRAFVFFSLAACLVFSIFAFTKFWRGKHSWGPKLRAYIQLSRRLDISIAVALLVYITYQVSLQLISNTSVPVFGWDGWDYWILRSKLLYYSDGNQDLQRAFTEGYPKTVSLMVVWVWFALGRVDDSIVGIAWFIQVVGLFLGIWGQLRRLGVGRIQILIFIAALTSTPLLTVHRSLAGYADLHIAVSVTLAALGLFIAHRTSNFVQYLLGVLFCLTIICYKLPGRVWLVALLPSIWLAISKFVSFRAWVSTGMIGLIFGVLGITYFAISRGYALGLYGMSFDLYLGFDLYWSAFVLANSFNCALLCILVAFVVVPLNEKRNNLTLSFAMCLGGLVCAVALTNTPEWWGEMGTINRGMLHIFSLGLLCVVVFRFASPSLQSAASSAVQIVRDQK